MYSVHVALFMCVSEMCTTNIEMKCCGAEMNEKDEILSNICDVFESGPECGPINILGIKAKLQSALICFHSWNQQNEKLGQMYVMKSTDFFFFSG